MMSVPHCETCRFWGKPEETDAEFRTCTAVIHDANDLIDGYYAADDPKVAEFRAANRAVVVDGSGFLAALLPRRDFGCVLHEPA